MQSKYFVGGILVGALVLTGCSSSDDSPTAYGRMDDIKYSAAKYENKTRIVNKYDNRCTYKTRTKTSGSGSKKRTTTERYKDCDKVKTGSHKESYRAKVSDAKYCIELDSFEYSPGKWRDDAWFTVSADTYNKFKSTKEGYKVRGMPYHHEGC